MVKGLWEFLKVVERLTLGANSKCEFKNWDGFLIWETVAMAPCRVFFISKYNKMADLRIFFQIYIIFRWFFWGKNQTRLKNPT